MYRVSVPVIFLFLLIVQAEAQNLPVDSIHRSSFEEMRQYASDQKYETARNIGYGLLEKDSLNYDVWLYLARIYGWESKYDSAYVVLDRVLSERPELIEPYMIRVDLAYWENDWLKLESYAEAALELEPQSKDLRRKYQLARYQKVLNREGPELILSYFLDHFREPYQRNWHMVTLGGVIPIGQVILSPYINGGYHPGGENVSTDIQFNLDAYLHLGLKNYMLAGYGLSPDGSSNYLPRHRATLELWQVLPAGFALSGGLRYFYWEDHFTFLTFSGEKYAGDYWFSLRNYLFFKDYGPSTSWYLGARRYFANRFNYVSATIGYGTAPDEPLLVVSDLERLSAISVRAGFSWQVRYNLRWQTGVGFAYEEFADLEYRYRLDFRTGLYVGLKW